jgi:hypothetical protein
VKVCPPVIVAEKSGTGAFRANGVMGAIGAGGFAGEMSATRNLLVSLAWFNGVEEVSA